MTPSKLQESNAYKKDIFFAREVKLTKKNVPMLMASK